MLKTIPAGPFKPGKGFTGPDAYCKESGTAGDFATEINVAHITRIEAGWNLCLDDDAYEAATAAVGEAELDRVNFLYPVATILTGEKFYLPLSVLCDYALTRFALERDVVPVTGYRMRSYWSTHRSGIRFTEEPVTAFVYSGGSLDEILAIHQLNHRMMDSVAEPDERGSLAVVLFHPRFPEDDSAFEIVKTPRPATSGGGQRFRDNCKFWSAQERELAAAVDALHKDRLKHFKDEKPAAAVA